MKYSLYIGNKNKKIMSRKSFLPRDFRIAFSQSIVKHISCATVQFRKHGLIHMYSVTALWSMLAFPNTHKHIYGNCHLD